MRLVTKIIGNKSGDGDDSEGSKRGYDTLADGALDTLGTLLRVLGEESFTLDSEPDATAFRAECEQFARHVENGAAVPAFEITQSPDGTREWSRVRRFFADRRRAERSFVAEKLGSYRDVVEDLLIGLRQIGDRDLDTESQVQEALLSVEEAVSRGRIDDIKTALTKTVEQVTETFARQKQAYEDQLGELNDRLSNLRQDLTAAREEMQRDALTDAYNRGAFDKAIEQSRNLHLVLNQPVTLVMIDLDNFKQVNDTHGHAAGDKVLRAVSECLARAFIRRGDLVARYGGDEFAVILNDTSAGHSTRLIERFLQQVSEIEISSGASFVPVSCSAGYTEIHQDDTVESLIERADRALYDAKAGGRNAARLLLHADRA